MSLPRLKSFSRPQRLQDKFNLQLSTKALLFGSDIADPTAADSNCGKALQGAARNHPGPRVLANDPDTGYVTQACEAENGDKHPGSNHTGITEGTVREFL